MIYCFKKLGPFNNINQVWLTFQKQGCESCKSVYMVCWCSTVCLGSLQLHVCHSFPPRWVASASLHPAGNTQPWVWNVFTFWACYKLSAKTNFAWLGRSLLFAQMLFGSSVFQRFALSIQLSLSGADRGSPSQMWTQRKGKTCSLCWCFFSSFF